MPELDFGKRAKSGKTQRELIIDRMKEIEKEYNGADFIPGYHTEYNTLKRELKNA